MNALALRLSLGGITTGTGGGIPDDAMLHEDDALMIFEDDAPMIYEPEA